MNYKRIYDDIIERAKTRPRFEGYGENHHILPKCMGGTYDKENMVRLTAREHFICHMLLTKIYPGSKMALALFRMITTKKVDYKISSRVYELIRGELKVSDETKRKISETLKRNGSWMKGRKMPDDIKEKLRLLSTGRPMTDEHKLKIIAAIKGKERPDEVRQKISESSKGRIVSEETRRKISETKRNKKLRNNG